LSLLIKIGGICIMRWSDLDSGFRRNDDMPKLAFMEINGSAELAEVPSPTLELANVGNPVTPAKAGANNL
jgi:hypothetical protein